MYTRKQFLITSAKQCFDFVRECISFPSVFEEGFHKEPDSSKHESLFLGAMRLGIDPGTMNANQLSKVVNLAKEQQ